MFDINTAEAQYNHHINLNFYYDVSGMYLFLTVYNKIAHEHTPDESRLATWFAKSSGFPTK